MIELLNFGEVIAIGFAVASKYKSSFLWFLFGYVCLFTFTESNLFSFLTPQTSSIGYSSYHFILAMMICVTLPVFVRYSFLAARILTGVLSIQAIFLFTMAISGMNVYGFTTPESEIMSYIMNFINVNVLLFETIIAWIVATSRKG